MEYIANPAESNLVIHHTEAKKSEATLKWRNLLQSTVFSCLISACALC